MPGASVPTETASAILSLPQIAASSLTLRSKMWQRKSDDWRAFSGRVALTMNSMTTGSFTSSSSSSTTKWSGSGVQPLRNLSAISLTMATESSFRCLAYLRTSWLGSFQFAWRPTILSSTRAFTASDSIVTLIECQVTFLIASSKPLSSLTSTNVRVRASIRPCNMKHLSQESPLEYVIGEGLNSFSFLSSPMK